jgi:hypothetical protein|tara:strand:- start:862 stop:1152 length:291 start_codon:yes stop_codon:yes gene_type:complete
MAKRNLRGQMDIFKIEDVPMPEETRGRPKGKIRATLEATDIGKSFLIPNKFLDTDTSRQQVYRCVQALNKFNDEELYSVKTFVEEKGLRVFRVEER